MVYGNGLENRRGETHREFESLPLRHLRNFMIDIRAHHSDHVDVQPTFNAAEFEFTTVELSQLASLMGRGGIFTALVQHQLETGVDPATQVWAAIDGASLYKKRTLFSDENPLADPGRFNENFFATGLSHWRSILNEVKYSPFTYLYKGVLSGKTSYPVIAGFSLEKLEPLYPTDDENVNWSPVEGETVETSLASVYYFPRMFVHKD